MRKFLILAICFMALASVVFADSLVTENEDYYKSKKYQKYMNRSARTANPHKDLTGYTGASYCESCHPGAIEEVMDSTHYKWSGPAPANYLKDKEGKFVIAGTDVGKKHKIGDLPNTYPLANHLALLPDKNGKPQQLGCGKCHIGGGYLPTTFEKASMPQKDAIDCLICHAETYDLSKRKIMKTEKEKGYTTPTLKGTVVTLKLGADMSDKALQSVGRPTSEACMRCHYHTGGGPLFKRGVDYAADTDVHAAKGITCSDCHIQRPRKDHGFVRGPGMVLWSYDHFTKRETCIKCHPGKIHKEPRYDADGEGRVACVTCHVKTTGGLMARDFSKHKQSTKSGFYLFKSIVRDEHTQPLVYKWWDQTSNPEHVARGAYDDPKSRLWPFKEYKQTYPVDAEGNRVPTKNGLIFKKGWGPDKNGNGQHDFYEKAVLIASKQGRFIDGKMENPGLKKSPLAGFKDHTTDLMVSHGILPKEQALQCKDCHGRAGVLDWKALGMKNPKVMK